jgi:hypothetical protein
MLLARRRRRRAPSPALAAALALTAAAGAAFAARRRRGASGGGTGPAPAAEPRRMTCACGQELRVTGQDRHQVFWLVDAAPEDPVVDDRCPSCERQLSAQA